MRRGKVKLMKRISLTELRNKAAEYFDEVEAGAAFEVCKRGKPIAHIRPVVPAAYAPWLDGPKKRKKKHRTGKRR